MPENNPFEPKDVYQLFNDAVQQATGRTDLVAYNTPSFLSVGEVALRVGTENLLNSISTVLSRTIFAVRPYRQKLESLRVSEQRWGGQVRKITPLLGDFEASQDLNTDLSPNQLADGQSIDMYKIKKPEALQLNFYGTDALQTHITRFRHQLNQAFSSESEFMRFIDAIMVQFGNLVELGNEQKTRLALIHYMAGLVAMEGKGSWIIDLTKGYNQTYGTTYTRQQLLTEHLTSFMQYFVSTVKIYSDRLTDFTSMYHANITGKKPIVRHTPYSKQKMIMYAPLFTRAEASVFSEIFNPLYLKLGNRMETVNFWQNPKEPEAISATPKILDVDTGNSMISETSVNAPHVVGLLFDDDALGVMPKYDYASTTPFNSAGGYYNMYLHWMFKAYADYTENAIMFIMSDGETSNASVPAGTLPSADKTPFEDSGKVTEVVKEE